MAETKKLKIEIEMDATGAIKGIKGLGKESSKLAKDSKKNSDSMKKNWSSTITGINQGLELAKKAFTAFKGVFNLHKEFLQYRQGMDALARNTGQNADMIVAKLKEVSDGTVANKDLMLAANRAVALNVTKDVDKMSQLMEISRLKAKAMGIDTTQAFNDMVTGIGRGSPLILDNLGIITKGWAEEAKAAGVAMDAQFILNKVLKDGAVELENAGEQGLTGAERIEKLAAVFENLKLAIGGFLKSDAVKGFITFATETVEGVTAAIESWSKFGTLLSKSDQQLLKTGKVIGKTTEEIFQQFDAIVKNQKALENLAESEEMVEARTNFVRDAIKQLGFDTIKTGEDFVRFYTTIQEEAKTTAEELEESLERGTEFTDEELQKRAESWNQYYTFIGDQRSIDRANEQADFESSQLALTELFNQRVISKQEFDQKMLELQLVHDVNMAEADQKAKDEAVERDRIANEEMGKNFNELSESQKRTVDNMIETNETQTNMISSSWETAVGNVVSSWADGMAEMIIEGKFLGDTLGSIVKNLIKEFGKLLIKMALVKAAKGFLTGGLGFIFKEGGMVPKMAGGGKLSGPSHSQGGIRIEAEGGEYFVKKQNVTRDTLPILQAINNGITDLASLSMAPVQKFAEGGPITTNNNSTKNQTANINSVKIVSPDPRKLFNQFFGFASDMGVNLLKR